MKRLHRLSPAVLAKIGADYKEKLPDGSYRFTLKDIARNNFVTVGMVRIISRHLGLPQRHQGVHRLQCPSARVLKILRDATEPGMTLVQVGIRNARIVNGKVKPLSKQRVKQIIDFWKKRGNPGVRSCAFKRNDLIEWNSRRFRVVRYDNPRRGAVIEVADGKKIDPFLWVYQNCRSKLIERDGKLVVPEPEASPANP